MTSKRQHILNEIDDLVGSFFYYDRKEDEDLPRGAIEEAIANNDITVHEITSLFRDKVIEYLK